MKGEICLCPETWRKIRALMRIGTIGLRRKKIDDFIKKVEGKVRKTTRIVKKRRTPKQIRATKKLIAFNKRRRLRR